MDKDGCKRGVGQTFGVRVHRCEEWIGMWVPWYG